MTSDPAHIPVYMLASTLVLAAVIWICAFGREPGPRALIVLLIAGAISVGGIVFAKYGANAGLPWWIYYTVPMLATVFVPPLVFRLGRARSILYVVLAFATAPLIHLAFVKLLGWTDYMPFLKLT
jgi:hypothetical protein